MRVMDTDERLLLELLVHVTHTDERLLLELLVHVMDTDERLLLELLVHVTRTDERLLLELLMHVTHTDERLLLEFRQQEVDALQHKVTSLRGELKTEMNHARDSNEAEVGHFHFCLCYRLYIGIWETVHMEQCLNCQL